MELAHHIIVFDAADLDAESAFWAGVLGGRVDRGDSAWHTVHDAAGTPRIGVQLALEHRQPEWPDGTPQQLHLDLYVTDLAAADAEVITLGARMLREAPDPAAAEGFQVYADPAGHPFCLCWR